MKKNKLLFGSIVLFSSFLAINSINFNNNTYRLLAEEELNTIYIGDSIDIENRSLDVDGVNVPAKAMVYFPDGSSYSGKSFIASIPGLYRVVYTADNGTAHQVSQTVKYKCIRTSADMFIANGGVTMSNGDYRYNNKGKKSISGAILDFKTNSSVTYNRLIDITEFDKTKPILDFIVDPTNIGVADFKTINIRFTDSLDENIYVDVLSNDSGEVDCDGMAHYVRAAGNGQLLWGFEGDYASGNGIWHSDNYGQSIYSSYRGWPETDTTHDFKLYFDYADKAIYASPMMWSADTLAFINDLDSPEKYLADPWGGFPSGKAKLTISLNDFSNASGRLVIKSVAGVDLSGIYLDDDTAPIIDIDYQGQSATSLPRAVIGKKYNIFPAIATDDYDGDVKVNTSVTYLDTTSGKEIDVSISDNAFVPKHSGTYTITYSASDLSGNKAVDKKIKIYSSDSVSPIELDVNASDCDVTIFNETTIPDVSDVTASGGTGKINITRTVINPKGEEIAVKGRSFTPELVGNYQIVFEAIDYIGNTKQAIINVNSNKLDAPLFIDEANLPPVMVKGFKYTIPELEAIETNEDEIETLKTSIKVNGGDYSNSITATGESMEIVYVASGVTGTTNKTYNVPVIDGNNTINQAAYFYGDLVKTTNEDDISLSTSVDGSVTFATKLNPSELSLFFSKDEQRLNFDNIDFKLVDSTNKNNVISFSVSNEDNAIIKFNNGVSRKFGRTPNGEHRFYFDNSSLRISDVNDNVLGTLDRFDNGEEFIGFTDGVYLTIGLSGVTGESSIKISKINNQPLGHKGFGDENFDSIKPTISYDSSFSTEQNIGETFVYPTFKAFDVLSDIDDMSVKIVSPSGKLLVNGDASEHKTFTIDEYGFYVVTFIASESSGNTLKLNRTVYVYDNVAPTISVDKLSSTTYGVGDVVKLPSYTANDNSGEVMVDVILILPDNQMRLLTHEENGVVTSYILDEMMYPSTFRASVDSFKTEQKGKHILRYVARDAEYNKFVVELEFNVK